MSGVQFQLSAEVRSANRDGVLALLRDTLADASIEQTDTGLLVAAKLEGESARDLNRALLSALRRVERRTTLRAEWSSAGTVERFFDYAAKGTRTIS